MKKLILSACLLISLSPLKAQTPDNTSPGGTTPNNNTYIQPQPVSPGTVFSTPSPNTGDRNPTGTGGTDMTNPNNNGSYESNPKGTPRDNFQSNPNTSPTLTRQPQQKSSR